MCATASQNLLLIIIIIIIIIINFVVLFVVVSVYNDRKCASHRSYLICKQQYPIFIASAYTHIFVTLILEFVSVAAV